MGRLIDEARATTAAVEEENRQRQIREGVESERKKEKRTKVSRALSLNAYRRKL